MSDFTWFYVISHKWTKQGVYCFWGPNDAGYTNDLKYAWKYSKEQIDASFSYYNNDDNMAIPCAYINTHFRTITHIEVNKQALENYIADIPF